ncbi:uncharacterized protein EKO05_0009473 [Ascochyta rabiei]|uniref:uncharacterized protein n=1 Tax=Didymella rabiei TaxID=5454 RepID=UPI0021FD75F3|nr:uncharacterized protein EKO05_0009473 [Ascochyta rabiei]UPX19204.1 hypothetical protein EKO05_0009473 [Ascochyta rabiei]
MSMLHLFKLLALLSLTTLILALPTGPPPLSTSATLKHQPNHPNSAPPRKSLTVALSTTKLEATKRPPQSKCILICTHAHCDLLCANPHTTTSLPVSTSSANPTITNTTSTSSTASTNINTNITTTVPQPAHLTISSLSSGMDAVILDPRSQTGQMQRCAWTCSAATGRVQKVRVLSMLTKERRMDKGKEEEEEEEEEEESARYWIQRVQDGWLFVFFRLRREMARPLTIDNARSSGEAGCRV